MNSIDLYDGITLHQGDCRDIMRAYPDQHFDAVITDPPYGISFKGEKWDTATPHGFQSWAQSWGEEALRVLKPGGYLLAFSAPRTYHRLASGLEDAGFEIRDAMAWIRADGKPGGMDLSSAFDRDAGVLDQREGRDVRTWAADEATATHMSSHKLHATGEPITDEAKAWEGWGVGLKPAWEPIVVARRPLECRLVDNVRAHGTGAMNIRSAMDAGGGAYPPNLLMGERAMAAAVEQGAPDHVWPVFRYQPKAPTSERPKVGGTARHREAPRAYAVPGASCCAPWFADPRTVRRIWHHPTSRRHGEHARGRLRTRRPLHSAHQSTLRTGHRSTPRPVQHGR